MLAEAILKAGPESIRTPDAARELLADQGALSEPDVAQAVGAIVQASADTPDWPAENLVAACNAVAPDLDWHKVMEALDYEGFYILSQEGLELLIAIWKAASKDEPFPVHVFFGNWQNKKGQISALYRIATASTEQINVPASSTKTVIDLKDYDFCSDETRSMASQLASLQLNSQDFIKTVLDIQTQTSTEDVKLLFDVMLSKSPELMFLGLLQTPHASFPMETDMLRQLLMHFLNGQPGSAVALTKLKQIRPTILIQGLAELYNMDKGSLSRILEILIDLHAFPDYLDQLPQDLAIDLACLAAQQGHLNLERWLYSNIVNHREEFVQLCLDFLEAKYEATTDPLQPETVKTFIHLLQQSSASIPVLSERLETIRAAYGSLHPSLNSPAEGLTNGNDSSIDDEANAYFAQIYKGALSVEQMIASLEQFSVSNNPREREVFVCIVHVLLDEYTFFSKYPDKELAITNSLFSAMLLHRLMPPAQTMTALSLLLESLQTNEVGSRMYTFAVQALTILKPRLAEWPQFCAQLLQTPSLEQTHPELLHYIQAALQQPTLADGVGAEDGPKFTALWVPPVPQAKEQVDYKTPPEDTQDKILFLINNVAANNLESKTSSLMELLDRTAYQWFSDYLVVKRASIEPNYHELYLSLLAIIADRLLYDHVLRETYANILKLLNSDKTLSSSSERSLLKNLGAWLGGLTLARDKPIKHKDVSFKDLLLEGYDSSRLIVVIPFVCKVLEQGSKGKVFKPPNPWVMAILKVLAELYNCADLKLNLKFEVEVLCKTLSIDLADIEATSILKNRGHKTPKTRLKDKAVVAAMARNETPATPEALMNASPGEIAELAPFLVFSPHISLYNQPMIKQTATKIILQCVRDAAMQLVDRAVSIGVHSTRDIILKDFAMEADENKLRKSTQTMVTSLSGAFIVATSKEMLRSSISTSLKPLFMEYDMDEDTAEQASYLTAMDNMELGSAIIERVTIAKARLEIDRVMSDAFSRRRNFREQRHNQPYIDVQWATIASYVSRLPPALRITPQGLEPGQLRIYDDFGRIPRRAPATADTEPAVSMAMPVSAAGPYANNGGFGMDQLRYDVQQQQQQQQQQLPQQQQPLMGGQPQAGRQVMEQFGQFITELENLLSQMQTIGFTAVAQQSLHTLLRQLMMVVASSFNKVEVGRMYAQKTIQLMYNCDTQLAIEVYAMVLQRLCQLSTEIATPVTAWLTRADDERKYIVPVTVALVKSGLVNLAEHDQELASALATENIATIEYATRLIWICLFEDPPVGTRHDFMGSLEVLHEIQAQRSNVPKGVSILLEEVKRLGGMMGSDQTFRDQLRALFVDWVQYYRMSQNEESTLDAYVEQLFQQPAFKEEETVNIFFRQAIEFSVSHATQAVQSIQHRNSAYLAIDALAKLVIGYVHLVSWNSEDDTIESNELTRILSIVVLILVNYHETLGRDFSHLPFLRLFIAILTELHTTTQFSPRSSFPALRAVANVLYTIRPKNVPGFAFAWYTLVSHRMFMPKLLMLENQVGWRSLHRLLESGFKFMSRFLQIKENMEETTRLLYRAILRILLVLLHDFPEFLCDYHHSFCDALPVTSIQLRNIILSAFPRNMRLPDPFMPQLKVDLLPEILEPPRILSDYKHALKAQGFIQDIDAYLNAETSLDDFVAICHERFVCTEEDAECRYQVPVMNAFVFYVGLHSIINDKTVQQDDPHVMAFNKLMHGFDPEGRYLFISAIANQLRYPNSHTYYFSCLLLCLFGEAKEDYIKEQITRVLLERLIVNRPHPWGSLITFIELMKNKHYKFWEHEFTRCATEIKRLFESVSRRLL